MTSLTILVHSILPGGHSRTFPHHNLGIHWRGSHCKTQRSWQGLGILGRKGPGYRRSSSSFHGGFLGSPGFPRRRRCRTAGEAWTHCPWGSSRNYGATGWSTTCAFCRRARQILYKCAAWTQQTTTAGRRHLSRATGAAHGRTQGAGSARRRPGSTTGGASTAVGTTAGSPRPWGTAKTPLPTCLGGLPPSTVGRRSVHILCSCYRSTVRHGSERAPAAVPGRQVVPSVPACTFVVATMAGTRHLTCSSTTKGPGRPCVRGGDRVSNVATTEKINWILEGKESVLFVFIVSIPVYRKGNKSIYFKISFSVSFFQKKEEVIITNKLTT